MKGSNVSSVSCSYFQSKDADSESYSSAIGRVKGSSRLRETASVEEGEEPETNEWAALPWTLIDVIRR